jgi:hypothetical protein
MRDVLARMIKAGIGRQTNVVRSYLHAAFVHGAHADLDPRRAAAEASTFRLESNPVQLLPRIAEFESARERVLEDKELQFLWATLLRTRFRNVIHAPARHRGRSPFAQRGRSITRYATGPQSPAVPGWRLGWRLTGVDDLCGARSDGVQRRPSTTRSSSSGPRSARSAKKSSAAATGDAGRAASCSCRRSRSDPIRARDGSRSGARRAAAQREARQLGPQRGCAPQEVSEARRQVPPGSRSVPVRASGDCPCRRKQRLRTDAHQQRDRHLERHSDQDCGKAGGR